MCLNEEFPPLRVVTRDKWDALPPTKEVVPLVFPIPYVIVHWSSGTELGKTEEECKEIMRDLQKRHREEEGFADVGFNFVIGGDGKVYEGRGWWAQPESKFYPEFTGKRFDIAYMGEQDRTTLPFEMLYPALQLLTEGVKSGMLHEDYESIEIPEFLTLDEDDDEP